jgi:hypothetical protein
MSDAKHGSQGGTRRDLLVAGGVTFIAWGSSAIAQPARLSESTVVYKMTVEQMIAGWKGKPQAVARAMLAKYGLPHEATPMRIIAEWGQPGSQAVPMLSSTVIAANGKECGRFMH